MSTSKQSTRRNSYNTPVKSKTNGLEMYEVEVYTLFLLHAFTIILHHVPF